MFVWSEDVSHDGNTIRSKPGSINKLHLNIRKADKRCDTFVCLHALFSYEIYNTHFIRKSQAADFWKNRTWMVWCPFFSRKAEKRLLNCELVTRSIKTTTNETVQHDRIGDHSCTGNQGFGCNADFEESPGMQEPEPGELLKGKMWKVRSECVWS